MPLIYHNSIEYVTIKGLDKNKIYSTSTMNKILLLNAFIHVNMIYLTINGI